jgi:hypothetical protein
MQSSKLQLLSVTHTPGGGALKLILAKGHQQEQNEDRDDAAGKKPKPHDENPPVVEFSTINTWFRSLP